MPTNIRWTRTDQPQAPWVLGISNFKTDAGAGARWAASVEFTQPTLAIRFHL